MKAFSGRSSTYALALVALPILTALVAEQILEYVEEEPLSTNDTFIEFGGSKIRYLQAGPTGSGANNRRPYRRICSTISLARRNKHAGRLVNSP